MRQSRGTPEAPGPELPPPLGAGDPADGYLWLLPPFWGLLSGLFTTSGLYALKKSFGFGHSLEAWWARSPDAMPASTLAQYGEAPLLHDTSGEVMKKMMEGCVEPITHHLQMFVWVPVLYALALPWPAWSPKGPLVDQSIIGGLPEYAFIWVIFSPIVVTIGCSVYMSLWSSPDTRGETANSAVELPPAKALTTPSPTRPEVTSSTKLGKDAAGVRV